MKVHQQSYCANAGWQSDDTLWSLDQAQWIIVTGQRELLEDPAHYELIRQRYAKAEIISVSSAGDIQSERMLDNGIVLTAIELEKSRIQSASTQLLHNSDHNSAGRELAHVLSAGDLRMVFLLSDGHYVNVGQLVEGLNEVFGDQVPVSGGLAADGLNFSKTVVGLNNVPEPGLVVAIGLYGDDLAIGHGSKGGWTPFGPYRTITRSDRNELFEMDGESALSLYKKYLGERAKELPGAALLFPLHIKPRNSDEWVVRTVLSINEERESMIFAGDVPVGATCRLMRSNFNAIIDGAQESGQDALPKEHPIHPELAILVSCVGRKLLLGSRIEEELEEVRVALGDSTVIAGFYSYGELSPPMTGLGCQLHNQTMTITTLAEL